MRPVSLIFALTAAAGLGGCAPHADVAAEERAIRELERRWVKAVAAEDTTAIGNVYAEDGEFLPPGAPRVSGRAAVRSAWAGILKAPNLSLTFESSKVVVSSAGDLAVATGPYKLGLDGPKGHRIEDAGKFVEAWTRVNGEWKVLANIFNSDKPPT
jgi:uncharacterized protein (TIGR02246 family)